MKLLSAIVGSVLLLPAQVIEGTVVNSVTGTPVSGVQVTVHSTSTAAYQAITDSRGIFRLENVKSGTYTAVFSKSDFQLSELDEVGKPFTLGASSTVSLAARLTPFGTVLGRVLDANGEPVAGAQLLLSGSRLGLTGTSGAQGRFSFQAAPGRYTLMAKPPEAMAPPTGDGDERLGWVGTYYPGVTDSRDAAPIVVAAGSELWGQDIRLKATPMRHVRGLVLDTDRKPAGKVQVRAARTDETLLEDIQTTSTDEGTFDLPCLYDGEWVISAELEMEGIKLMASAAVQVNSRELDPLDLRLSAPFPVRGTVSVAGAAELASRTAVLLRPTVTAGSQELSQGSVNDDGTFQIDHVYPRSYKVIPFVSGLPVFLASLRMGGRDILGQYVALEPGSPPLEIMFDSKGGHIRGKVEACGSAVIVLVPQEDALHDPQFVQKANCSDGAQFEMSNLRPGDYYAFAFNRWDGPVELLATLNRSLINQAVSVHIRRGETAVTELRVTVRKQ